MLSELEKSKRGLEYCFDDGEVVEVKYQAIMNAQRFNSCKNADKQIEVLNDILGSVGTNVSIVPPFNFDNGKNIHIGSNFIANFNLTILDICEVCIGDNVMIGPNTLITSVGHPLSPQKRRDHLAQAKPITIGDDVWLGGNVTVLPGVKIGNNVVIGGGAVVTKDIPCNSLAVGIPARVIKKLENDLD